MTAPVRVRFSPAPTGSLHVGSARTALFNWLFARHHRGEFVLRVEDTDPTRSRAEWVTGIQATLRWLGLDWDGKVVLQSQRFAEYRAAAEQLVDAGAAYECFCTTEEIAARNETARAQGRSPGYDGHCRDLSPDTRRALVAEGRPLTLRFRTPDEGTSSFVDLIRGDVRVEWSTIPDFVIIRSDGTPLFFLANAVDDLEMAITHIIRGEDLLDSTHRVLALRAVLSSDALPAYAHLPLILGPDRSKLSKRHGAVGLEELRADGYLPEALRNYLALLGWAPDDGREVLRTEELIELFDLGGVTHANAAFDHDKLDWMNGEWIRRLSLKELEAATLPAAEARYGERLDLDLLCGALSIGQERATTLRALLDQADFLFAADDEFAVAPDSWDKLAHTDRAAEILDAVLAHLGTCDWTPEAIDLRPALTELGVKPRQALPAVYAAVEGRHAGLPLFDSIHLLGRDRAVRRIEQARERLEA
jgi:glutamyl-tRNA synthetase